MLGYLGVGRIWDCSHPLFERYGFKQDSHGIGSTQQNQAWFRLSQSALVGLKSIQALKVESLSLLSYN